MILLESIDESFSHYIPTTIFGLVGLVSAYLYLYFRKKDDNKLQEIESANPNDRIKAIEMSLNDLGVTIDTSNLDPAQKFALIGQILKAKTRKYLIIAITSIILAAIIAFVIHESNTKGNDGNDGEQNKHENLPADSLSGKPSTHGNATSDPKKIDSITIWRDQNKLQPIVLKKTAEDISVGGDFPSPHLFIDKYWNEGLDDTSKYIINVSYKFTHTCGLNPGEKYFGESQVNVLAKPNVSSDVNPASYEYAGFASYDVTLGPVRPINGMIELYITNRRSECPKDNRAKMKIYDLNVFLKRVG